MGIEFSERQMKILYFLIENDAHNLSKGIIRTIICI